MRTTRFILLVALSLTAAAVFLTRPSATLHAQASDAQKPEYVTYQSGAAQWLSAPHTLALSQNVKFGQDDATLETEAAIATLDKDQNLLSAKAQGPVHIYDPQDDLRGLHGTVDFTKHLATLTDNITLIVKPGKRETNAADGSPRKSFKDPATLTCAEMTYDYRRKIGRIPGPLTVTQVVQTEDGPQTRTLTAEGGLYNGKAQTIQLVGTIKGTYSDGSVIEGDTRAKGKPVIIGTKEGAEYVSVPFQTIGHFTVKPEKADAKNNGKSDATDSTDDDADLSLPVPPPHTPIASSQTASQTPPTNLPPVTTSTPVTKSTPATSPSPAGKP